MEDLTAASVDDVKAFFRTYYAPGNATLVIAGDFDSAKTKQLVEQYFGPIPRRRADHAAARARGAADRRQAHRHGGEDPAAAALRLVSDAGELRARRSRAGSARHRARRRQVVAPLQAAGLRDEDRAVGQRRPAEPAARVQLRDHRVADARPHAGRDPGRHRRGDRRRCRRSRSTPPSWIARRTSSSRTPSAASRACSRAPSACSHTTTWSATPASSPRTCAATAPSTPPPSSAPRSST